MKRIKSMKVTALLLAAAMMLTGCSAGELSQSSKHSVTNVTEEQYTANEKEGLYTGEWKDGVPNGNGELIISDTEYYKGEWCGGILLGQGEISEVYDDGSSMYYKGKCADNTPIGEGYMFFHPSDSEYYMVIYGNFADESTLCCFITDHNKKLFDIGGISNGEFVSYIDNPDIEGISCELFNRPGTYIGEVDENNVPNGYGYYTDFYQTLSGQCHYGSILGSWKDGNLDGYYTSLGKVSNSPDEDYIMITKYLGCKRDKNNVGDYEEYCWDRNGLTVKRGNYDTYNNFDTFELGEDGIYGGSYEIREYFYNDGTYGYSKRRQAYTLNEDGSRGPVSSINVNGRDIPMYCDGEYCNYDRNGNIIDYGIAISEGWQSQKPNEISLKNELIAAGVLLLGAYATYEVIIKPSNEAIQQMSETFEEREYCMNVQNDLRQKAEREEKYGNKEAAERLRQEADNIGLPSIPW